MEHAIIEQHIRNPNLSLTSIAKMFNVNEAYVSRVTTKYYEQEKEFYIVKSLVTENLFFLLSKHFEKPIITSDGFKITNEYIFNPIEKEQLKNYGFIYK